MVAHFPLPVTIFFPHSVCVNAVEELPKLFEFT